MYLIFVSLGLCLSYFIVTFIFSLFFKKQINFNIKKVLVSLLLITSLSLLINFSVDYINDRELANRLLHGLGGGFLALLLCFLVVKDHLFSITKLQFFIFVALIVTGLGVANEIIEFIMQNYFDQIMAESINDTWLDLVSNSFGLLAGSIIFTPFIPGEKVPS